jgi:hypothetical protein
MFSIKPLIFNYFYLCKIIIIITVVFSGFSYLDYNIFQVISCDSINDSKILDIPPVNPDKSWAMTTIRPSPEITIDPLEISDIETIPDSVPLRNRRIILLTIVGTFVLLGIITTISVLSVENIIH